MRLRQNHRRLVCVSLFWVNTWVTPKNWFSQSHNWTQCAKFRYASRRFFLSSLLIPPPIFCSFLRWASTFLLPFLIPGSNTHHDQPLFFPISHLSLTFLSFSHCLMRGKRFEIAPCCHGSLKCPGHAGLERHFLSRIGENTEENESSSRRERGGNAWSRWLLLQFT